MNTSPGSGYSYNWTQTNVQDDQYDAVGAIEHEISEDMGRVDAGGSTTFVTFSGTPAPPVEPEYTLLDMFRYTASNGLSDDSSGSAAGARDEPFASNYSANAYSYFSYNGSTITNEYDTPTEVNHGEDIGDWTGDGSVTNDSYGTSTNGQAEIVSQTDQEELAVLGYDVTCFLAGTSIATERGAVAVEDLAIGDRVVTVSGMSRPIRWIGVRGFLGRFAARNPAVLPILFRAGALADGVPRRDLFVSPRHAMFLDGMLIEAAHLVNGVSIVQIGHMARIDYFHIELESHDVILAEGAPSESFVDDDSRMMFHNARDHAALYPDAPSVPAVYCAPRVSGGFALDAVRQRLEERAGIRQPAARAPLRGFLDRVGARLIEGWAQNPARPDVPVCLDILLDGQVLVQTLANRPRADLRRAGIGDGRHGFSVRLPFELDARDRRAIQARRSLDHEPLRRNRPAAQVA